MDLHLVVIIMPFRSLLSFSPLSEVYSYAQMQTPLGGGFWKGLKTFVLFGRMGGGH